MSIKETKIYFETLFASDWTDTDIHYAGQEFDGPTRDKWINPVYKPLRSRNSGVSDTTTIDMGQLYIVCWAEIDLEVMELADDVINFISENLDKQQYREKGYEIIDHGWGDSNKVFVVLSFTFEKFNGTC